MCVRRRCLRKVHAKSVHAKGLRLTSSGYHKHGSGASSYYLKLLKPDSEVYKAVNTMLSGFFESNLVIQVSFSRDTKNPGISNKKKTKQTNLCEQKLTRVLGSLCRIQPSLDQQLCESQRNVKDQNGQPTHCLQQQEVEKRKGL